MTLWPRFPKPPGLTDRVAGSWGLSVTGGDTVKTYIDPEERAYNTLSGGHSRSNRRGKVLCEDGRVRTARLGIPDTYFTIPAHTRINGRYITGWVTAPTTDGGAYCFHARQF